MHPLLREHLVAEGRRDPGLVLALLVVVGVLDRLGGGADDVVGRPAVVVRLALRARLAGSTEKDWAIKNRACFWGS